MDIENITNKAKEQFHQTRDSLGKFAGRAYKELALSASLLGAFIEKRNRIYEENHRAANEAMAKDLAKATVFVINNLGSIGAFLKDTFLFVDKQLGKAEKAAFKFADEVKIGDNLTVLGILKNLGLVETKPRSIFE